MTLLKTLNDRWIDLSSLLVVGNVHFEEPYNQKMIVLDLEFSLREKPFRLYQGMFFSDTQAGELRIEAEEIRQHVITHWLSLKGDL